MTLLLDGAVGTELARRGFVLAPPSFSAAAIDDAPELLAAIHRDYVDAGADVLTTATTCVHRWYVGERSDELVVRAVATARAAIGERSVQLAGALAMLPREVPDRAEQYVATARALADAGVDILLCESFTSVDELALAARACEGLGITRWGAIVPTDDGTPLGGGAIEDALALGFDTLAVHCCSLAATEAALTKLRNAAHDAALGAYPALAPADADRFAQTLTLLASRFTLACIGACCGSTPATIATLR
ncbi:MAG TPA: homocysteine S-methyltransferase family protein [Nannocystaceae bacterium]|nr:homocysteine S-methyltransferase family protein [Nannocystaceae bacterium]